eukprot:TRINITY_DN5656_c0_g1_i11.p1 TRINITY_DN5656_c0_g1~~TRINITY_DN5656_c0_g1_i11.p1  ORF type:complete len:316 (-),score=47.67 TRINITY_DN5656_c0_g1_i11:1301-2248(-)
MDWVSRVYALVLWYVRPLIKWFLRQTTRLCELQRICYGEPAGAPRTLAVHESLAASRNPHIRAMMANIGAWSARTCEDGDAEKTRTFVDQSVKMVMKVKLIKPDLHRQFITSLSACLKQMISYKKLVLEVEALRSTAYDEDKLEHEVQLLELWRLLQPDRDLEKRVTKQWQDIGFQGEDPKTDFRGMGLLGLHNLIYFAREHSSAARHILSHSHHPKYGFSFAIVGINLTHMAYKLLVDNSLRTHLFNLKDLPDLKSFHHFYCYLFVEFDKFWLECEPRDIMEFNRIRDIFESNLRSQLHDRTTCFKLNLEIDTV